MNAMNAQCNLYFLIQFSFNYAPYLRCSHFSIWWDGKVRKPKISCVKLLEMYSLNIAFEQVTEMNTRPKPNIFIAITSLDRPPCNLTALKFNIIYGSHFSFFYLSSSFFVFLLLVCGKQRFLLVIILWIAHYILWIFVFDFLFSFYYYFSFFNFVNSFCEGEQIFVVKLLFLMTI